MVTPYRFHYRWRGKADRPVLLFLHGFMGDAADWDEVAGELKEEYRCLTLDLPGHGMTAVDGPEENCRMERVAQGLITLLDELEVEQCSLVGYSMGGRLGLYLAVSYPERFERVVLESTSPGLKTEEERTERRKHDAALANRLLETPLAQFLEEWYDQPLFAGMKQHSEKLEALIRRRLSGKAVGYSVSLRMMGTGRQPSLWEKLDSIAVPALLVTGKHDAKFGAIAEVMSRRMEWSRSVSVDGAGHNVHWEQPEEFIRVVREFLSE